MIHSVIKKNMKTGFWVEHMLSMCKGLDLIPSTERKDVGRKNWRRKEREKEDGERVWKGEQYILQYGWS